MTAVPVPLLLLAAALALVAVVLLWKLLMTAGLLGLAQWVVITQTEDPTAVLVALGVPALITVLALSRLIRHRSRPTRLEVPR